LPDLDRKHCNKRIEGKLDVNIILIVCDTFRFDNLSCYAGDLAKTPNLDSFSNEAFVFDNAYLSSFPTVPARRDLMTGQYSCVHSQWGPLPSDSVVLQQILSQRGIATMLIADTPHIFQEGFNYCRDFDGYEWIRGQDNDHFRSHPRHVPMPEHPEKWCWEHRETLLRYRRNIAGRKGEEDCFAPQTITAAMHWLDGNGREAPFFLYLDLFDPHEPWDAPQKYVDLYDPGYKGSEIDYPLYGFWEGVLTPEELRHCRALYSAEVTMVDEWLGRLLKKIDDLGLQEDTAVIFTSDHGFMLGEHDFIGKSKASGESGYEALPFYQEIARIPLLIRLPDQNEGMHVKALAQFPDLMPTVLELAGIEMISEGIIGMSATQLLQCGMYGRQEWKLDPDSLHGVSLVPLMRGEVDRVREIAVSSHTLINATPAIAKTAIVTDDGWCLHYAGHYPDAMEGTNSAGLPICPADQLELPAHPSLYFLPDDPGETNNLLDANSSLAKKIHGLYVGFLESVGTPERYLSHRRKFVI